MIQIINPLIGSPEMKNQPLKREEPISFKTFPFIKKRLIKLAAKGNRSLSREMERLIKEAPLKV